SNRCTHAISEYPGGVDSILYNDFILDARAAVEAVRSRDEVAGTDVVLIGHSEGAYFVPLIVSDEPGVIAGARLSGPALPGDQIVVEQLRGYADYLMSQDASANAATITSLRDKANWYEMNFATIRNGTYVGSSFDGVAVSYWLDKLARTDHLQDELVG